jgi:cation transport ATPase
LLLQDWLLIFIDANIAFNVFTAVLIVACPCALALTAPFTLECIANIRKAEILSQKCVY